jgi:hypothetical protein
MRAPWPQYIYKYLCFAEIYALDTKNAEKRGQLGDKGDHLTTNLDRFVCVSLLFIMLINFLLNTLVRALFTEHT